MVCQSSNSALIIVSTVSFLLIITLIIIIITQYVLKVRMSSRKSIHRNETYDNVMTSTRDVPVAPNEAYALHKMASANEEVEATYELVN